MSEYKKNHQWNMICILWGLLSINNGFAIDSLLLCIIGGILAWEGIKTYKIIPYPFVAWLLGIDNEPSKKETKDGT